MPVMAVSTGGIALRGAPDSNVGSKGSPMQAMQLELTHDIVDELLENVRSGKPPQILFGRTPQLKYGDKTRVLQTNSESYRYELYSSSGAGSDDGLEFAGLINHSLAVQQAESVTAGVDSALQQLKSSMAAISEFKQANKTIVGDAAPSHTPNHRRFPSKGFKAGQHLGSPALGSPLLSVPSSPMPKPPTSQPSGNHDMILRALRVPLIHLLAIQPSREGYLAETCRTSLANVRDLLPKIAKRSSDDTERWQLTDKSFRELNPWKFTYKQDEDREQAITSAVKSFDRLRLAKDDKLWQMLLPVNERGQGKCLSRLSVKAPEQKASTPLHKTHKLPKLNDKKPAAPKKPEDKDHVKEGKKMKEVKEAKEPDAHASNATSTSITKAPAPPNSATPSTNGPKIRTKKVPVPETFSTPRARAKLSSRDMPLKDRAPRPARPAAPVNTKPKNPSPLSASPPVNASDFEDSHPVHKALSGAPSPAKMSAANSDRSLKRKANDIDSDIHNHSLSVKPGRVDRPTPTHTPLSTNGRLNGSTPSSATSVKRKSDDSSTSNTPSTKIRKVTNINTGLASRYPNNNSQISPGSSSSATSPSIPSLSFRQTVELSQKFQTYYKKYEELYWQLAEADTAPTEGQRNDLMKMHKKLEEMKREIKAGAGVTR
ncbi:hypothetical protein K491DRAFT_734077 [Lophiostoma macrostomum CBS 122681]|uniref:Uncharacterized protein n=1 Tax=Lophiostoma macrostomum CBS 122681 TaxID=1314788 RepID=A0A6A6TRE8_9PLEO|nr:hypothetical protein K491DRAFT_734077 [Lophiostoma macrostomum CBS 122681]